MANLTPEQERINSNHIKHQANGSRHDPGCPECVRQERLPQRDLGTDRAKAYNAIHGTQVADNAALDRLLRNERELAELMGGR